MSSKQAIFTENAPSLPGIYNQAIVANRTVYCSGTIGIDPSTGKLIEGDVQDRTVSQESKHCSCHDEGRECLEMFADRHAFHLAPNYPKFVKGPRGCGELAGTCRQGECVPCRHGGLFKYERSLHAILGRRGSLSHVGLYGLRSNTYQRLLTIAIDALLRSNFRSALMSKSNVLPLCRSNRRRYCERDV